MMCLYFITSLNNSKEKTTQVNKNLKKINKSKKTKINISSKKVKDIKNDKIKNKSLSKKEIFTKRLKIVLHKLNVPAPDLVDQFGYYFFNQKAPINIRIKKILLESLVSYLIMYENSTFYLLDPQNNKKNIDMSQSANGQITIDINGEFYTFDNKKNIISEEKYLELLEKLIKTYNLIALYENNGYSFYFTLLNNENNKILRISQNIVEFLEIEKFSHDFSTGKTINKHGIIEEKHGDLTEKLFFFHRPHKFRECQKFATYVIDEEMYDRPICTDEYFFVMLRCREDVVEKIYNSFTDCTKDKKQIKENIEEYKRQNESNSLENVINISL